MSNQPFQVLQDIARGAEKSGLSVPLQQQGKEDWRGVGFSVTGQRFIAPMAEVDEILYMPNCTRVPGVKSWVSGVANVRGRLLSVIDLGDYFGGKPAHLGGSSRVLVIRKGDLYSGVIVDEVLGMQTFTNDQSVEAKDIDEMFQPFVKGAFVAGDKRWNIFSLFGLAESAQFLQVAI